VTSWLFLIAYTCSGLAGLIYEVTWTRMLTLFIGHTTAAASTVVAAFLGGLAIGAGAAGRIASRLTPKQSLRIYVGLELAVAACALLLPLELTWFRPLLRSAYHDGGGASFSIVRVASCMAMVMVPAAALGATYPMAIRWFSRRSGRPATESSALYFVNTAGAAVGALLAGFVLIPTIGMNGTVYSAVAATMVAALSVLAITRSEPFDSNDAGIDRDARGQRAHEYSERDRAHSYAPPWLAITILGLSALRRWCTRSPGRGFCR
jgi:spermidine synthase